MNNGLRLLRQDVRGWLGYMRTIVRRSTAGPLLVRLSIFVMGAAAMILAYPPEVVLGSKVFVLIGAALVAALAPRRFPVTALILAAVAGWLVNTAEYGLSLWRLLLLMGLLYMIHSAAALAAVLAYDAVIAPGALARWYIRSGLVVAVSGGAALVILALPAYIAGTRNVLFMLVGTAVAMAVVLIIVHQLRRSANR
jgi:hypothetical protein